MLFRSAVLLANWVRQQQSAPGQSAPVGKVLHESLTDGAQLLLLGTLVVLGAFVVETLAVLGADQLAGWLRGNAAVTLWLERILGGIMVLLGLTLAFATL